MKLMVLVQMGLRMLLEVEQNQKTAEALKTAIELLSSFELEAKIASVQKSKNIKVIVSAINKDFACIHREYAESRKTLQNILASL